MFLAEHNLPFTTMDHLPQLIASVCPDSKIAKKLTIKRKKTTQLITNVLGPANKEDLVLDLKKNYFSLIIDETTDVSTKKCLTVNARYFKSNKVVDRFLALIEVENGTAKCLFESIKKLLEDANIPFTNVIGLGADNCSVMLGDIKGVKALMQQLNPNIITISCMCHSFHLCSSYACEKLPKSVEQLARDIYNYFSNSSKRCSQLKECEIFAQEKPHKMLKPSQTRWLSLQAVINRIIDHWTSLELFFTAECLEQHLQSNNAQAILEALKNPVFKLYFYFLSYILEIVNNLNLEFQSESPKIHLLLERVTSLYKLILRSFLKADYLKKTDVCDVNVGAPGEYLPLEDLYAGAKVNVFLQSNNIAAADLKSFRIRILDFYVELSKQIKKRFNFNEPAFKFAAKLGPKLALSGSVDTISEAAILFPFLDLDIEQLDFEYRLMSETNELKKLNDNNCDINEFWSYVDSLNNQIGEKMFPNVCKVAKCVLSLPHSSAAAERIFSQLNLIKTNPRNRLLVTCCEALLHTKDILRVQSKKCFEWQPSAKITGYSNRGVVEQEVINDDIIFSQ